MSASVSSSFEVSVSVFECGLFGDVSIKPPVTIDVSPLCTFADSNNLEVVAFESDDNATTIRLEPDDRARNEIINGLVAEEEASSRYTDFARSVIHFTKNQPR